MDARRGFRRVTGRHMLALTVFAVLLILLAAPSAAYASNVAAEVSGSLIVQEDDEIPNMTVAAGTSVNGQDSSPDYDWLVRVPFRAADHKSIYSSDESVVKVGLWDGESDDDNEYWDWVEALSPGKATLYDSSSNEALATIQVVAAKIKRIGAAQIKLSAGKSTNLYPRVTWDVPDPSLVFNSTNSHVASVDEYGELHARLGGKAIVSAKAPYGNTVKWKVVVKKKVSASKVKVKKIKAQTYTGRAKEPRVDVVLKGNDWKEELEEGRDYRVTYFNNVDLGVGTAKVTLNKKLFKGNRTLYKRFKIKAPTIDKPRITAWASSLSSSAIKWHKGAGSHGVQLVITGAGNAPYSEHFFSDSGYGWSNKAIIGSKADYAARSFKNVGTHTFYSGWVRTSV